MVNLSLLIRVQMRRRSSDEQGRDRKGCVSVFVNNLPERRHWRWMQQLFGYHGRVMDVFIPKKRGAAGRRFGFVRYGSIRDARRAIERLDDFMMMNQRLGRNMVQFQGRKTF
uniref:RRM domain-containing protein n=1 Tax=Gossypium raimondii TaxID=29730 RepID=A0A0D2RQI3_GOSRA|nr:hypothetical protein B456_009G210200 [Gossypium raimondii]